MICCGYGGAAFVYDPTSTIVNGTASVGVYGNDLCAGSPFGERFMLFIGSHPAPIEASDQA